MHKELIEFEEALDNLIKSKLKNVKAKEVKAHFGDVKIYEYVKLIMWSAKE